MTVAMRNEVTHLRIRDIPTSNHDCQHHQKRKDHLGEQKRPEPGEDFDEAHVEDVVGLMQTSDYGVKVHTRVAAGEGLEEVEEQPAAAVGLGE